MGWGSGHLHFFEFLIYFAFVAKEEIWPVEMDMGNQDFYQARCRVSEVRKLWNEGMVEVEAGCI
jgi:hypothetical protein